MLCTSYWTAESDVVVVRSDFFQVLNYKCLNTTTLHMVPICWCSKQLLRHVPVRTAKLWSPHWISTSPTFRLKSLAPNNASGICSGDTLLASFGPLPRMPKPHVNNSFFSMHTHIHITQFTLVHKVKFHQRWKTWFLKVFSGHSSYVWNSLHINTRSDETLLTYS